jgi:hypothetical protein
MIVKYAASVAEKLGTDENGKFVNNLPIHDLLGSYHWARLDDDYVFVIGSFSVENTLAIADREDTLMLPYNASGKRLLRYGSDSNRQLQIASLAARFNLTDQDTMSDLLDQVSTFGVVFMPSR